MLCAGRGGKGSGGVDGGREDVVGQNTCRCCTSNARGNTNASNNAVGGGAVASSTKRCVCKMGKAACSGERAECQW